MQALERQGGLSGLHGRPCFLVDSQLQHGTGSVLEHAGDGAGPDGHNNGVGLAATAAAAARCCLDAARAEQDAAQLSGLDVPMFDDLLPLEDLHDPFLEDLGSDAPAAHHYAHAGAGQQGACDPSDPAAATCPFSPSAAGFLGIPAYAEPDSPAAALLNNGAPLGAALALPAGAVPLLLPHPAAACPPGLPLAPQPAAALGAQPAYAAATIVQGQAAAGLPPAIAAAQQRAAAATAAQEQAQLAAQAQAAQAAQAQLAAQVQALHAQQAAQQAAAQQAAQQALSSVPAVCAAAAEKAGSGELGGGGSRMSNGSSGSAAPARLPSPFSAPAAASLQQQARLSDDSSSGAERADLLDGGSGAPTPAASGSLFTGGVAEQAAAQAPAKRGGRPREKKSYDALIDPSLPIEEIRRLRRVLSNRESARRSRRRRQTQLSTLEEELEQLKTDKTRLESELHQTSSFAQQLSAERQQLVAEVERLRRQLAAVSTSPAAPPSAPPPAPHTGPHLGAPLGHALGLPACLPGTLGALGSPQQMEPAAPAPAAYCAAGTGRLPHFIEQAQLLASKLTEPRSKDEAHAAL